MQPPFVSWDPGTTPRPTRGRYIQWWQQLIGGDTIFARLLAAEREYQQYLSGRNQIVHAQNYDTPMLGYPRVPEARHGRD